METIQVRVYDVIGSQGPIAQSEIQQMLGITAIQVKHAVKDLRFNRKIILADDGVSYRHIGASLGPILTSRKWDKYLFAKAANFNGVGRGLFCYKPMENTNA